MKYCPECGAKLEADDEFCPDCGAKIPKKKAEAKETPKAAPKATSAKPTAQPAVAVVPAPSGVHYAGFWIRVVARLIDTVIVFVPMFIIISFFGVVSASSYGYGGSSSAMIFGIFFVSILGLIYFIALDSTGGTLGKRILGLRTINIQKQNAGVGRAVVRHFVYSLIGIIPFIGGLVVLFGYIWVGIDQYKQGWHDKMAGTYVIYKS